VLIKKKLNTLFVNLNEGGVIWTDIMFGDKQIEGKGLDISLTHAYCILHMLQRREDESSDLMCSFSIPLCLTEEKSFKEYPYLLQPEGGEESNQLPVPLSLVNTCNSIMKGWIFIFDAMSTLNEWEHKVYVLSNVDRDITVETGTVQKIPELLKFDKGTYPYTLMWLANFTGKRTVTAGKKTTDALHRQRQVRIISWVLDGQILFKIETNSDIPFKIFPLEKMDELITEIKLFFYSKTKLQERWVKIHEMFDERVAPYLRRSQSKPSDGHHNAIILQLVGIPMSSFKFGVNNADPIKH
jgi:hypothetical protein